MKHLISSISILLFFVMSWQIGFSQVTQEWVKRYNSPSNGSDITNDIEIDNSGNIHITGNYNTIKYNSSGDTLWTNIYGVTDTKRSLAIDNSGNVYTTGYYLAGFGLYNYGTLKINSAGIYQWYQYYNSNFNLSDSAASIAVDDSGNVYVTGASYVGSGQMSYATIKYNSSGAQLWVKRYQGSDLCFAKKIAVDKSHNVYVTGNCGTSTSTYDFATLKYNSAGTLLWAKKYNGTGNGIDITQSLIIDTVGNVYVTGQSQGSGAFYDYATIKYNPDGDSIWVRRYSGPGNGHEYSNSISVNQSGNVFVTGMSHNGSNFDIATIKYDANGDSVWIKRFNGTGNGNDIGVSLLTDAFGNVYLTGTTAGSGSGNDFVTIKYHSNGDTLWVQKYNGPANNTDYATGIVMDTSGNVYVTGASTGIGTNRDYTTIKYSQSTYKSLQLTSLIEGLYENVSNKMIKDTARVNLRNTNSPFAIVDSAKTVLDSTGNGTFAFSNADNGTPYYIIIKHRNSIETWSAAGQSFNSGSMIYDFTTAADKAYGNNLTLKGSRYCIYSGEVNLDGNIDLSDVITIYNDVANFVSGYKPTDVNGDNQTDLTDLIIAYNNSVNFVSVKKP